MLTRLVATAAVALLLTGCGFQQSDSAELTGEEERVADVVDDLRASGTTKKADHICERVLTPPLAERVAAGGKSCPDEMDKAIGDADEFALDVQAVDVTGSTAKARVKDGAGGVRTLELVRQGADWRISGLGTGR